MADEPISKRLRQRSDVIDPQPGTSASQQQQQPRSTHQPESNPAPENAPPNSLLRLNEKCLTKLFKYLDAETFATMANTCKRFRITAEKVYPEMHKEFKFTGLHGNSEMRRVIRKFGQFITSFDAGDAHFYGADSIDVEAIVKYCRPNLRKLSLVQAKIKCNVIKPLFPQLTDLSFDMCDFVGDANDLFENCPNLEHLFFEPGTENDSCAFLVRNYSKMDGLAIDCAYPAYMIVYPMLKLNPQIKYLTLMALADDHFISHVVECTKNVERLRIRPHVMAKRPQGQTKGGLVQLAKLKKLTHFTMDVGYEEYAELIGPLADAFSKANVPLEKLDFCDVYIDSKDIKSINKLKTMKRLLLNEMRNVKETDLISLTANLPLLVELQLYFGYGIDKVITVDGLVEMIKNAKHLGFLALMGIRNLRIDQEAFEKVLNAVQIQQEELTIHINGCKTTTSFNVPENIQKANAKRLVIVHEEDDDNRCGCKQCEDQ